MSESVLCPILVGRASELVLLEDWLRQATEGTGRAALVTGDAGIGKSRLVAELVGRAAAGGAQVLSGACAEGELTASFLPFVEAIGNHLAVPDPARGEFGAFRHELARLLPRIAHIQLADNPGRNEPGTGEINWSFLFAHLDRIGYKGWIGCEYKPRTTTVEGLGWHAALTADT